MPSVFLISSLADVNDSSARLCDQISPRNAFLVLYMKEETRDTLGTWDRSGPLVALASRALIVVRTKIGGISKIGSCLECLCYFGERRFVRFQLSTVILT